jgi:hypothetical protein
LQGATAGLAAGAAIGGAVAGPPGALVGGVAGGLIGGAIGEGSNAAASGGTGGGEGLSMGPFAPDSANVAPRLPAGVTTGFATMGQPTNGFETAGAPATSETATNQSADQASASVDKLDTSLDKTDNSADKAATATDTLATSLTTFGDESGSASTNTKALADAMQQADEQFSTSAQSIPNSISSAQSSLQGFFDWLTQAAAAVADAESAISSSGGGGGPQLDKSDSADIGQNAVGGIYTIGSSGGVASGSTRASGTDTINLKGTVSPGEIVAVIPADKANQATMSALQTVISDTQPISIGGGNVSGTGANVSAELAGLLDGTGKSYPSSLSDPATKDLLAQIKALLASQYNTKSLTPAQGATAPGASGPTASQQGDPFAEIKKQDAEAEKRRQEEDKAAANAASKGQGAQPASRAASGPQTPRNNPGLGAKDGLIVLPKSMMTPPDTANPFSGSQWGEYMGAGPYDPGSDLYDPYYSSFDAPVGSDYFDPYSAYPGGGVGEDTGTAFSNTGNYDQYSGFDNSNTDYSAFGDYSVPDTSVFDTPTYDSGTVDIGSNATGGIYTVGGGGATPGNSGITDALSLVGKVSPGEIVAVIPPEANTSATMSTLQSFTGTNITSLGGGGASTLNLTDAQVQDALAKVKALIAAQLAAKNLSAQPAAQAASGGGGGGFNTKKDDNKDKKPDPPPKEEQPAKSASSSGGSKPSKNSELIKVPKTQGAGGAEDSSRIADAFASKNSTDMPFDSHFNANGGTSFFDPYSAFAANGYGFGGNSFDLPYNNPFFTPDFGIGANNYSFDNSAYFDGMQKYMSDIAAQQAYQDFASGAAFDGSSAFGGPGDFPSDGQSLSDYYDSVTAGFDTGGGSSFDSSSYSFEDSGFTGSFNDFGGGGSDIGASDPSFYDPGNYDFGDAGDYATGGTFTVPDVPGGGTDTANTRLRLTGGETVSIFPKGMFSGRNLSAAAASATNGLDQSEQPESAVTPHFFIDKSKPDILPDPTGVAFNPNGTSFGYSSDVSSGFNSDTSLGFNASGAGFGSDTSSGFNSDTSAGFNANAGSGFSTIPRATVGVDRADALGPTMRGILAANDRSINLPTSRALGGHARSIAGLDGSTTPIALDRNVPTVGRDINAQQRQIEASSANARTVNVNVFGVRNADSFAQSRQAVTRAARLIGQG